MLASHLISETFIMLLKVKLMAQAASSRILLLWIDRGQMKGISRQSSETQPEPKQCEDIN